VKRNAADARVSASWLQFFVPIVKWITFVPTIPGQAVVHRMAQANFNVRGWQGR
jgi:hypothetical protein